MSKRKPTAEEMACMMARANYLAGGDAAYAKELAAEVAAAGASSYSRLEILNAIFSLVADGLIIDSGERRNGRIVWAEAPTLH